MGALTLKTFPFELRGWELQKFNAVDVTDSFGTKIKVCINNNKIVHIENCSNDKPVWLHDKARQFFDAFNLKPNNKNLWSNNKILYKIVYLSQLCNLKFSYKHYYTVFYENLNVNVLALLTLYSQKFAFLKFKRVDKKNFNNNLESHFLITNKLDYPKLKTCSLALIVANNLRLEGSNLNLTIKNRFIKGNFKCFLIGSFVNLTYNINFLGATSTQVIKTFAEGRHLICQNFKASKANIIINSELLKRNDGANLKKMLFYTTKINKKIAVNCLNLSIFETGDFFMKKPKPLTKNDLLTFNSLYLINLTNHNNSLIKHMLKLNLFYLNYYTKPSLKKICIDENFYMTNNVNFKNKFTKYFYLKPKTVFETKNVFINTQGLVKQTNEFLLNNKAKSNWQTIRYLFNNFKNNLFFLNKKNKFKLNLYFKNNKLNEFVGLNYLPLTQLKKKNVLKTNSLNYFFLKKYQLKITKIKFFNTKLKFWLNDFFTGGKDEFSKHSLIMARCSNLKRFQSTNFF